MAETMTYDPGTDTVTTEGNLTPDEQDSLQVGEQLAGEQEQLLAGKYKNAEELEKAYVELQKKLGDDTATEESTEEVTEETSDEPQLYSEDGKVNYDQVNDTYGESLGNLFKESNIDPWSINNHFHENNGTITDDMYKSLESTGLSRSAIDSYLAGVSAEAGYTATSEVNDLNDNDVSAIKKSAGGEKEYNQLINWAASNLPAKQTEAFDTLIETGNVDAIQLAVDGLKAKYENANGYEGRMLSGKAPQTSADVFRSQAEVVEAMSDPRYDRDPAYRQDLIEKLDRSNVNF